MDINTLQAFLAVAETTSFSQAAERLFLTQPAISKRIAALEESLGAKLFDRIGRQVALTEAGRALLPRAQRILAELEDSQRAIANLGGQVSGRLTFGTSHHIGLHRLPPILRLYTERYPEVKLDIRFMDSEEACKAVEHGDLELGIVTLPQHPSPALTVHKVWDDPLTIVAAAGHPLTKKRSLTPADLADYPAILPAPGTYTREVLELALQPYGLELRAALSTNYLETIKMLVSVGLGWSVLPCTMLSSEVRPLKVDHLTLARQLGTVHHHARTLSNAAKAMLDILTR
ncbi:MAG TPA: LysR family transcriptional regulator [Gammaproteobacteria bacterium]